MYQWLQWFKASNERKTVLLLVMFPVFLIVICFLLLFLFWTETSLPLQERVDIALQVTKMGSSIILAIVVIRGLIVFFFQQEIMFSFSGAKAVTRKEYPEVYNIVENLCISRGLPMPKIGVIQTSWLNAFATGRRTSDSWIVFTSGLLERLDKREIEAVAGHELTHIINKDSLLMLTAVIFVGVISLLGEILVRTGSRNNNNKGNILPLIGLWCVILGYLIYPLIRLALSRKREYLADIGSVELTQDAQAMISALRKISGHAVVPSANKNIAMFFIESPKQETRDVELFPRKKEKSSIWDTHPSIDERIAALESF